MINRDFYIAAIIARYLSGEITTEESIRLDEWRNEHSSHEELFQTLCSKDKYNKCIEKQSVFSCLKGWENIQKRIRRKNQRTKKMQIAGYVAEVLLISLLIWTAAEYKSFDRLCHHSVSVETVIMPGQVGAVLTLDDGETFSLNNDAIGLVRRLEAKGITVQADSTTLNYRQTTSLSSQTKSIYNKIETPRGGEYEWILSDGTKVRLNAMSSLRFPVAFGENERIVELEGEAYFEVSHTGQPFKINSRGVQTEVLGTDFNISAYPDEAYRTTLVRGVVKVNTEKGESLILKPSQQAVVSSQSSSIEMRTVDTSCYTAWAKGRISFRDERLEDIMKVLSRWYDVQVIYESESVKNIRFGCNLNRYEEITPFVKLLEKTENVNVRIKEKTIIFY